MILLRMISLDPIKAFFVLSLYVGKNHQLIIGG